MMISEFATFAGRPMTTEEVYGTDVDALRREGVRETIHCDDAETYLMAVGLLSNAWGTAGERGWEWYCDARCALFV